MNRNLDTLTEAILGEEDKDILINTREDYRDAIITMMSQARQQIDIFTPDLEPAVFDTRKAEESIFRLSRQHPDTKIRILVKDSMRSVQNGHRLIRLAQRLTSSVFIHNPSPRQINQPGSYVIVDQTGIVFRTTASERILKATANFSNLRLAAGYQESFEELWEHSSVDVQTRRLYV